MTDDFAEKYMKEEPKAKQTGRFRKADDGKAK